MSVKSSTATKASALAKPTFSLPRVLAALAFNPALLMPGPHFNLGLIARVKLRTRPPTAEEGEEVGDADGAVDIQVGQTAALAARTPATQEPE